MARLFIAIVLIFVVVGAALAMAGVLRFHNSKNESTITIDKKELKEKAQKAVEKTEQAGGKVLDKTGEMLHKGAAKLRGSSHDDNAPTTPSSGNGNAQHPDQSKGMADTKEHVTSP